MAITKTLHLLLLAAVAMTLLQRTSGVTTGVSSAICVTETEACVADEDCAGCLSDWVLDSGTDALTECLEGIYDYDVASDGSQWCSAWSATGCCYAELSPRDCMGNTAYTDYWQCYIDEVPDQVDGLVECTTTTFTCSGGSGDEVVVDDAPVTDDVVTSDGVSTSSPELGESSLSSASGEPSGDEVVVDDAPVADDDVVNGDGVSASSPESGESSLSSASGEPSGDEVVVDDAPVTDDDAGVAVGDDAVATDDDAGVAVGDDAPVADDDAGTADRDVAIGDDDGAPVADDDSPAAASGVSTSSQSCTAESSACLADGDCTECLSWSSADSAQEAFTECVGSFDETDVCALASMTPCCVDTVASNNCKDNSAYVELWMCIVSEQDEECTAITCADGTTFGEGVTDIDGVVAGSSPSVVLTALLGFAFVAAAPFLAASL